MRVPLIIISFLTSILIVSCGKDKYSSIQSFYGQWKTSYGDTITFKKENSKNVLIYNMSMNPGLPASTKKEFTYRNNKLGIASGFNGNDFQFLQTFSWKQEGKSFEVQGVEWFPFISSTMTYFTFTKI